jgi:hypothetical protein
MKTVRMRFGTADGATMSLSLGYAKDTLTEAEVRTAMQAVIDNPIFVTAPATVKSAELVDRTVTELIEG